MKSKARRSDTGFGKGFAWWRLKIVSSSLSRAYIDGFNLFFQDRFIQGFLQGKIDGDQMPDSLGSGS